MRSCSEKNISERDFSNGERSKTSVPTTWRITINKSLAKRLESKPKIWQQFGFWPEGPSPESIACTRLASCSPISSKSSSAVLSRGVVRPIVLAASCFVYARKLLPDCTPTIVAFEPGISTVLYVMRMSPMANWSTGGWPLGM